MVDASEATGDARVPQSPIWRADPRWHELRERVAAIAGEFAEQRADRQRRRELDPTDFERLRRAGFTAMAIPEELGGLWRNRRDSLRPVCELLRILAHGDSSVALVASMHVPVLGPWLVMPDAPEPCRDAWSAQRLAVFRTVQEGAWWGTIASEPASGGDLNRTSAVARLEPGTGRYVISGQKHFGSGSGIASYMITTAVPEGESTPATFILDLRGVPWDGTAGMQLLAAWDGHGMSATQSHAFRFEEFPAGRSAWRGRPQDLRQAMGGIPACAFTAVIVGVVGAAFEEARRQMRRKHHDLRAYERVEWSRAELEEWLISQAFEGMLRAMETQDLPEHDVLKGKTAVAELAESSLGRLCRVLGGGTFSRHGPLGFWLQDVRALGFLRPPWGLAFDQLFENAFPPE
jgi:alkylation response protein AidB-like acyl-CoA dehydrogenase